jgi:hypothetical protein
MGLAQAMGPGDLWERAWLYNLATMGGLDWPGLLALLVVALVYFLAPAVGYGAGRRGLLFAALWVLVGRAALTMLKAVLLFFAIVEGGSTGRGKSPVSSEALFALFSLLEAGLFVLGMVLFVIGLASLRRRDDTHEPLSRRPFPDD